MTEQELLKVIHAAVPKNPNLGEFGAFEIKCNLYEKLKPLLQKSFEGGYFAVNRSNFVPIDKMYRTQGELITALAQAGYSPGEVRVYRVGESIGLLSTNHYTAANGFWVLP